jgi:NitT/TauT family transport system ATP-binding protein
MRQKVGFARALAVEPELLCLDEPFSALDVLSAESLRGELLELWTSGALPTKAILMVTHNIEEATLLADRIVVMDKGPGRVVAEVKVDLPHPRQRKAPPFLEVVDQVYAMLAGQTQPEHVEMGTAPGEAGQTRALPYIAISDLAGLLEHVHEALTHHVDIYKLATELKVDLDALLRLTETAELLGFATVAQGDITLTPLGETFAEASILARKEIFAMRIRRLPMFRWLLAMLRAADKHQLEKDVISTALELDFPPDEAAHQVEVAINWGRYAELLAYDDTSATLSLDTGSAPPTTAC